MSERISAPKTTRHLRELEEILHFKAPPPPIAKLIGFTIAQVEMGRTVFELNAGPEHANPMGTLHGGVICDLSDMAMGAAMATTLEDEQSFTTLDLTAKYFKPVWTQKLRATARVTKRTRSLGLIECEIIDEKDSLVAKVWSSCMVLSGQGAVGR